jgi:hypothetical protein
MNYERFREVLVMMGSAEVNIDKYVSQFRTCL